MSKILRETVRLACKASGSGRVVIPGRSTCSTTQPLPTNVPGPSKKVVDVPPYEVGCPGASKAATYKNPEYFCYHNVSFFEAEVEMNKYRLPQPSNKSGK